MSSQYIRNMVETWLQSPDQLVPYFNTINEEQNPPATPWCTAQFSSSYRETMTYCGDGGPVIEEGEVEVTYFGEPGIGHTDNLLAVAELDIKMLMSKRDPTNKLIITGRSAPFESSGGSADKEHRISIYLDYQYYE